MAALERRTIGELNCHVITAEHPECLVVLCHGFGAPGNDLVQIGAYLLESNPEFVDRVTIVFPEAPLSLAELGMPDGRAWWPLDMMRLNRVVESGNFRDLRAESPELLPSSRDKVHQVITELQSGLKLDMSQTIVGGFSQGSMLVTDLTLHADPKPAGLVVWSGTLLNEAVWRPLAASLSGLPIVQSHGTTDEILPFEAAESLKEMFNEAGAQTRFLKFSGGHTIPPEAIQATSELIQPLLKQV